jgi:hypothetical protein
MGGVILNKQDASVGDYITQVDRDNIGGATEKNH